MNWSFGLAMTMTITVRFSAPSFLDMNEHTKKPSYEILFRVSDKRAFWYVHFYYLNIKCSFVMNSLF